MDQTPLNSEELDMDLLDFLYRDPKHKTKSKTKKVTKDNVSHIHKSKQRKQEELASFEEIILSASQRSNSSNIVNVFITLRKFNSTFIFQEVCKLK